MPVHDGSGSDQDERLPPPGPAHSQRNPEQFGQGSQSTARSLRVQSQQLPTESQVFEDEVHPATERTDQPAEEMSERHDHGKNFSGKRPNQALRQVIHFAGVRPFGEGQRIGTPESKTDRPSAGSDVRRRKQRFWARLSYHLRDETVSAHIALYDASFLSLRNPPPERCPAGPTWRPF